MILATHSCNTRQHSLHNVLGANKAVGKSVNDESEQGAVWLFTQLSLDGLITCPSTSFDRWTKATREEMKIEIELN